MLKNPKLYKNLILLLSILFFTCKAPFSKGNFHVDTPQSWISNDTVSSDGCKTTSLFYLVNNDINNWKMNILISVVHSKNLKKYVTSLMSSVKKDALLFQEKGNGETDINGYKAIWVQYLLQSNRGV